MKFYYILLVSLFLISCAGAGSPTPEFTQGEEPDPPPPCGTVAINLSWAAPTEREDNTALDISEIYSYKIYFGFEAGTYSDSMTVVNNMATTYKLENLKLDSTYYLVMTTQDTDARESAYSPEISVLTGKACKKGEKPAPVKRKKKPTYKKPDWCDNNVELSMSWETIKKATSYEVGIGFIRGRAPVDKRHFNKKELSFKEVFKRGQSVYFRNNAKKGNRQIKSSQYTKFQVLTCEQLEAKLKQDSSFKEVSDIKILW